MLLLLVDLVHTGSAIFLRTILVNTQLYLIKLACYNQMHHLQSILGTKKDALVFLTFASFQKFMLFQEL